MADVILQGLSMKRESKSYTDSLHAVLTHAELFRGPKYALSGYTGMAFKLSIHERLLPMSVTAYGQWGDSHKPGIDNLGIFTVWDAGRTRHSTFEHYRQDAVNWVRKSLDEGKGIIYWIPEFGVIYGYDDTDRVFYVQDGWSEESQVVLYDNFGLNPTGFWYCQIFGDRVQIAEDQQVLESLRLAIEDWDTPYRLLPDKTIASGREAYEVWRKALLSGEYDEAGAAYILDSYCHSRMEIQHYLRDARLVCNGLDEALACYEQLGERMSEMKSCLSREQQTKSIPREMALHLAHLLPQAQELEEQAVCIFRQISARHPDPKRSTVPRWGTHSAR